MAQVLDYASPPRPDHLTTILGTVASVLVFADTVAEIFLGNWHAGLGPRTAVLQDVVATIGICGLPLVGMVLGLLLVWRCRRGRWAGILWGAGMFLMHAWMLYVWGGQEVWFWSS
jgi:hypothetical protein